ncbi:hypothetical protein HNP40_003761 [Mycobacteroides chelonae]|nr:hypothetical protein [Mycobacteroides chelonae]
MEKAKSGKWRFLANPSVLLPTDTDENTREFATRYLLPLMRAAR